jgi:hypothetical protein
MAEEESRRHININTARLSMDRKRAAILSEKKVVIKTKQPESCTERGESFTQQTGSSCRYGYRKAGDILTT